MTDTLAQLLAGGLIVLVAAVAGVAGYRIGIRHGMRQGLIGDLPEEASRGGRRGPQPPRPPSPPRVIH